MEQSQKRKKITYQMMIEWYRNKSRSLSKMRDEEVWQLLKENKRLKSKWSKQQMSQIINAYWTV